MGTKSTKSIVIAAFFFFSFGGFLFAEMEMHPGRSGRVLAANLSGHGPSPESKSKRMQGRDIWWNYCIASAGIFYSVLSRESPEKAGLMPDTMVRFSEDRNLMFILKPQGKRLALRILRKDKDKKCP